MMRRICILLFLSFLGVADASAQVDVCAQRFKDINARFINPPAGLRADQAPQFISDNMREMIAVDLDCFLWDADTHQSLAAFETPKKPRFLVTSTPSIGTNFATPYVNSDGVINIPQEFPFYLFAMSNFLAHDAYVRDRFDPLDPNASLVDTPCRRSMIVPLLTPFFNFIRLNAFMQVKEISACNSNDQQRVFLENFADVITPAFVLLHENAHQRLGHPAAQVHTLAQELAADASALSALQIMREESVKGLPDDTADRIRWMFNVAPVLWLYADAQRVQNADGDARLAAALKFDPNLTDELNRSIKPTRSRSGPRVNHLAFDHAAVNYYLVDGLRLTPNQIPSTGLLMAAGIHTAVAVCPDGIAISRSFYDAHYTFLPFDQQANAIAAAIAQGDSEDIVLKGTTANFIPISSSSAWPWAKALESFRWSALISDDVVQGLTADQQKKVREWQASDALLASWR